MSRASRMLPLFPSERQSDAAATRERTEPPPAGAILHRNLGAKLEWIALSERELEAAELARARDDVWFAAWPALLHRLRPAVPWELPGLSPEIALRAWMAIRRIEPGPRVKRVFTPPSPPPDNEAIAHALFDLLEEFERTGASKLSIELINVRAALLGRSGSARASLWIS